MKIFVMFLCILMLAGCARVEDTQVQTDEPPAVPSVELAGHSTPDDCWIESRGEVFDISALTEKDQSLLDLCGFTSDFYRLGEQETAKLAAQGIYKGRLGP